MERYQQHRVRLGPLPPTQGLVDRLEQAGLRGRGGAGFPVATKWRTIAAQRSGTPVVIANGCEGEPLSLKDQFLMTARPHLVLDGALLAQRTLRAERTLLVVAEDHPAARAALEQALAERPDPDAGRIQLVEAPARYVSGESSAITHLVGAGVALPTDVPPRPHERGVGGRPTLVQNVETLAHVALAARGGAAPSFLATVRGAARGPAVRELTSADTVGGAFEAEGAPLDQTRAVLLGGYFGSWLPAAEAWGLPLDDGKLKQRRLGLGAAVIAALPLEGCGVCETAAIMVYLAGESSAQCGPCFFGLRAIADACGRIAYGSPDPGELERLWRWAGDIRGRGACHHPDGAVALLASALDTFGADFQSHRPHRPGAHLG
jgi:NADH:ubiquinone oxidoreductase subunit F (NADH-binding)